MATEIFVFGDFHALPVDVGPYTLLERIGSGGMAEVFLAELRGPAGFTKQLVLKRMLPEHKGVPELEKMFLREARLAAMLEHPGLMQTYELADVDGELFMVMEHVSGLDLSRLMRAAKAAQTRIPFDVVAGAISDVALGLHHMHTLVAADGAPSTVIHRDVSPDNIVLAHTGAAKLIDFGIAKSVRAEQLTTVGELKGKLRFMPPEQLRGQDLGPPADMHALGATLYRLLTGRHPYEGKGQLDLVEKILAKRPRAPRTIDASVPDDLAELALALLEKKPRDRPRADEVYGRIVERWPRDLRVSASFVAQMKPVRTTGAGAALGAAGVPGQGTTADERFDDESEVPTSARGEVDSAYREILSMRDDAIVAVAPEGTRIVTMPARPTDVHDRATRVVDVTATRTAQRDVASQRGARTKQPRVMTASVSPPAREPSTFTATQPIAERRGASPVALVVGALAMGGLGALFTALMLEGSANDAPPRVTQAQRPQPPAVDAPVERIAPIAPVAPVEPVAPVARVEPVAPAPQVQPDVLDVGAVSTTQVEVRETKKVRTARIELRGPPSVEWRSGASSIGKGFTTASLPADSAYVAAVDARTGGRIRVPIVDGVADFARVERGMLHVLVHPFGTVSIGPKRLGESPVKPIELPVGRYKVRVVSDDEGVGPKSVEKDVDVTPGTTQVKMRLE